MSSVDYPVLHFESPAGTKVNLVIDEYNNLYYNRINSDGVNLGWNSADRNMKQGDIQSNKLEDYLLKSDAAKIYITEDKFNTLIQGLDFVKKSEIGSLTGLENYLKLSDAKDTYVTKDEFDTRVSGSAQNIKGILDSQGNLYYPNKSGFIDLTPLINLITNSSSSSPSDGTPISTRKLAWSGTTTRGVNNLTPLINDNIDDYDGVLVSYQIQATEFNNGRQADSDIMLGILSGSTAPIKGYYSLNMSYPTRLLKSDLQIDNYKRVNLTGPGESFTNTDPSMTKIPYFMIKRNSDKSITVDTHQGQSFSSGMTSGAYYLPVITGIEYYTLDNGKNDQLASGTKLWEGQTPSSDTSRLSLLDVVNDDLSNVGDGVLVTISKYSSIRWDTSSADDTVLSPNDDTPTGTYFDISDILDQSHYKKGDSANNPSYNEATQYFVPRSLLMSTIYLPIKSVSSLPVKESSRGLTTKNPAVGKPSLKFSNGGLDSVHLLESFSNDTLGTGKAFFTIRKIETFSGSLPDDVYQLK